MSSFLVQRSIDVAAPPETVHALLDSFPQWQRWSPWEDLDPDLQRSYTGPDSGPGAHYEWSGNRKAGKGTMTITASTPEKVDVDLVFAMPFKATNQVVFTLVPEGDGTSVTWSMSGEQKGLMGLFGRLIPMDKLVGKDFEKGLARLKAAAEAPPS